MKSRFFLTIFVNLTVVAISIIVSLVLAESLVRVVAPQKLYRFPQYLFVSHPTADYALAPSFRGNANTHEYTTDITTNAFGIRDDREIDQIPEGGLQIIAAGDSFTMGVGVNFEETYVHLLEQNFNRRSLLPEVHALNFGVPGYHTYNVYHLLEDKGSKLDPSLILLTIFVGNDITQNVSHNKTTVRDGYLRGDTPKKGRLPAPIRDYLQMHSHLYQLIWPLQRKILDPDFETQAARERKASLSIYDTRIKDKDELWQATKEIVTKIRDSWEQRDASLVVVIAPEQLQVIPGRWEQSLDNLDLDSGIYDRTLPSERLKTICRDLEIPCIDLLPVFTRESSESLLYFVVDGHWNAQGNEIAALTTSDALAALISDGILPRPNQ